MKIRRPGRKARAVLHGPPASPSPPRRYPSATTRRQPGTEERRPSCGCRSPALRSDRICGRSGGAGSVIHERTRVVNRVQKLLEAANIKLASVVSAVQGVSARAMLAELAQGNTDAEAMAEPARGRLRHKLPELERALTGRVQAHQGFLGELPECALPSPGGAPRQEARPQGSCSFDAGGYLAYAHHW